jgi:hypothetical protein
MKWLLQKAAMQLILNVMRDQVERYATGALVAAHWPAVQETLAREFPNLPAAARDEIGHRAVERAFEHML